MNLGTEFEITAKSAQLVVDLFLIRVTVLRFYQNRYLVMQLHASTVRLSRVT